MDGIMNIYQYLSDTRPKTFQVLTLIGFLVVLSKVYRLLKNIYKNLLRPQRKHLKRYGANSWVLVTGSSDGIGKQFALCFAKRGFNIILSARTKSKLEAVKEEIKRIRPETEVKIIPPILKTPTNWGLLRTS